MNKKENFTKTIVIRITEEQYRKLRNSVRLLSNNSDESSNRSQIIREMINKYMVPKMS